MYRLILGLSILFILFSNTSLTQTNVSGSIPSDTIWTLALSPWIVTGTVTVPSGVTLTIQSGVVVKFSTATSLIVTGKIIADNVLFTSNSVTPASGDWSGIEFENSVNVGSLFKNNTVEYAGGGVTAAAIFYKTSAYGVPIERCTIRYSSTQGINARSSSPMITSSRLEKNGGYAIYSDLLSNFVVDSCSIVNNTIGGIRTSINSTNSITNSVIDTNGIGIFVDNSAMPSIRNNMIRKNSTGIQFTGVGTTQPIINNNTITGNIVWGFRNTGTASVVAKQNYWGSDMGPFHPSLNPTGLGDNVSGNVDFQPWKISSSLTRPYRIVSASIASNTVWSDSVYWITANISINVGITLTIKPGVIVKFGTGKRLTVSGTINAQGTTDSLIVFTSEKDDPYGGNTNGDTTGIGANRGDWDMVYITGAGSILSNCLFRYGGSTNNGNLRIDNSSTIVNNTFSTQSSYYGLYLNNANVTLSRVTTSGNSNAGMYLWNSNATIVGSTVNGNGYFGIWAQGTSRFSVVSSKIIGNANTGIHADYGTNYTTLVMLDSSVVSNNGGNGIYSFQSKGSQRISYSRIDGNVSNGIWINNLDSLVTIIGDTIVNNVGEGIVTSNAFITGNVIRKNRFPIALIGRLNSSYSGNTIDSNQYQNAIALRINRTEESFSDTLKAVMPAGMNSKVFVLYENSPGWGVLAGQTFVIDSGVIIKIVATEFLRIEGTIITLGTAQNPVVFTSFRDHSYGGKTNLTSDTAKAAPGDWEYIRIRTATANASILNNVVLKYGGGPSGSYSNLWLDGSVDLVTPIRNITSRRSRGMGVNIGDCIITFENCSIDSNASYGLYIEGNKPSDVTIRTSSISKNGSEGLRATNNSGFREISNCVVTLNGGWGIGTDNGTFPQVLSGNTVTFNGLVTGAGGIYNNSIVSATDLQYFGNFVEDNGGDGILSSRARFIDNKIRRNRFPISVWRKQGNIYKDNSGVDGNVITGNLYNNTIAIWQGAMSDTLRAAFPQAISSKTYTAIYNITVDAGTTLVIDSGVVVKFHSLLTSGYRNFNVYGTLIAQGTNTNPIIFTSWRDSTAGGKTTSLTDFVAPLPGDWEYIEFRNGSAASIVRNCQFRYGGRSGWGATYFDANLGGLIFSNNKIFGSLTSGITVEGTALTIDSTTVDSCGTYGIQLYNNTNNNVVLRHSKFLNNAEYGIWSQGSAKVSVISNCTVSGNKKTGIYLENNTIPLSVIGNVVNNNKDHGLYILARNDAVDTLIMIAGNKIRNNGLAGIFSSRAYVTDDSITGNKFPIGVTGQLSMDSTGTVNGNVYQNNVIVGNKHNNVLLTQGIVFGKLGMSLPANFSKVIAVRVDLSVPSGTTLKIAPGSIIKFAKEDGTGYIDIAGTILSEGTTRDKIVFTSWKDSTYGGNTNEDTSATLPSPGDWDRIYLNGSATNGSRFFHTIIRYGDYWGYGALDFNSTSAAVESSFISYSKYWGIQLNNCTSQLLGNEIHHNGNGVNISGSSVPAVNYNNIYLNTSTGLQSSFTGVTTNATNNFWGTANGPLKSTGPATGPNRSNLTGSGNKIVVSGTGDVNWDPYLTSRSGILPGDVSGNGQISAYDGSMILRFLVDPVNFNLSTIQRQAANVSGDTTVSAFDASYILRYVVGLISGFPGLGKQSLESDIVTAFSFNIVKGKNPDEFELIIHLNKPTNVYGLNFNLSYDTTLVQPISIVKTMESDSMVMFHHFPKGNANIAMSGIKPLNSEGDVARMTFKILSAAKAQQEVLFTVKKFVLNETDVTSDVGSIILKVEDFVEIPTTFGLSQNFPNPFNPVTTIQYQIPMASTVRIAIYNTLGQMVKMLTNSEQHPGFYSLQWNGRDDHNTAVASGIYIYRIDAISEGKSKFTQVKKMILLK
ncbi:MAG: right-handed parallel beta-helix repeat-containing protein [Bacteroidota bacterium]